MPPTVIIPEKQNGHAMPGFPGLQPMGFAMPTRRVTLEELRLIKQDLAVADAYVQRNRVLFTIYHYHGHHLARLKSMYLHIQQTMFKIKERGKTFEGGTATILSALLVADTDRYMREVIEFAQFRHDHPDTLGEDLAHVSATWQMDTNSMRLKEMQLAALLNELTPPHLRTQ
jgi:hypothetical protein